MKKEDLDLFSGLLHRQRESYLRDFKKAEEGLKSMAEDRESELEEQAQEEQSALFLTRFDDHTHSAIREIDAALQRILDGSYGQCERCQGIIALPRLRTLPATPLCAKCAALNHRKSSAMR
jgi:RNA polymerase-binding transcription factor